MSHSQFHCTSRAYLDMHGLIFETSICYWQDQPGRSAVSQRRRTSPEGRAHLAAGRTCRARGAHAAAVAAATPPPRSIEAHGGGKRERRAPLKHGPPHPRRRARLTDRPHPRGREHTDGSAERRGDASPPGAAPMAARGRGRGTGRSRRGWGGPARAHAGRGGGPGRSPVPPRTGEAARGHSSRDGRPGPDPRPGTRARAGDAAGGGKTAPPSTHHATAGPEAAADTDGRPQRAWEAPSTPGRGTGAAAGWEEGHQTAQRRGTRRRKQEKQRGKGPRAAARGLRDPSKAPQSPRSATGAHGVPPPEASSTRAVPWHPRMPTRPPAGPGNLAGLGPQPPRHRHDRPPERSPARAATPTPLHPARPETLLTRGREHFARGRPPPQSRSGWGGDNTQQRRGRFRSQEGGSGARRAFSHLVEAGTEGVGRR